jgi:hypothetical protein
VNKGGDYRPKGETILGEWEDPKTYREKANGAAKSVNRQGEMRLEAGSFRLRNHCSGTNNASMRLEANGANFDSNINIENGLWVAQSAGNGSTTTTSTVNRTSIMLHAKGRIALQGKYQALPGRW